jgi:hypothetical protein
MLPPLQLLALRCLSGTAKTRRELRQMSKAGESTNKALSSLEVFLDELDSLAGLTPSTLKPTTPTRPTTSTKVSKPPINEKPAPNLSCSDTTTPPPDPPLTAKTLETVLQTALLPVYARLDTLEASRGAAVVLPPSPPNTPPQPADNDDEAANASFAEVAARPPRPTAWPRPSPVPAPACRTAVEPTSPASHLVHLYAQPNLTVARVRQTLGIPSSIPVGQTRRGDVLIHLPTAAAASFLRSTAAAAGLAPATPLALLGLVVHGVPRVDEAQDEIVEAMERERDSCFKSIRV